MALIERLMHHPSEPQERFIPVHGFFAAVTETIYGNLTVAQVQAYYQFTPADILDWNALAALIPPVGDVAERALFGEHIHAVFILAEDRVPTYSTPAEVRTRLGI